MDNRPIRFVVSVVGSIAFWSVMAAIAESDIGAMIGFVVAFGLVMVLGPLIALGPVGPLAGLAIVTVYFSKIRTRVMDWGPLVAIHVIGFLVFAVKSMQSLDRAWP